jgi:death on curing protein
LIWLSENDTGPSASREGFFNYSLGNSPLFVPLYVGSLLESAIEHIQNDLYYPEIQDKLTHLVFAINKFHSFVDGNKRSSIALGAYFLELNGYNFVIKKFVLEMENIAVWVAEGRISKELLGELIESLIFEEDFSEELKFKLALAVM